MIPGAQVEALASLETDKAEFLLMQECQVALRRMEIEAVLKLSLRRRQEWDIGAYLMCMLM